MKKSIQLCMLSIFLFASFNLYANSPLAAVMNRKGKWGYINQKGKVVIPFRFYCAYPFSEGRAQVVKKVKGDYLWGYIDVKGKLVIPYQWSIKNRVTRGQIIAANEMKKYESANAIGCEPTFWSPHKEGRAKVINDKKKWGYIDKSGKLVIPYKYSRAWNFHEGLASVAKRWVINRRSVRYSGYSWGFINRDGKMKIYYEYAAPANFYEGMAVVLKQRRKTGYHQIRKLIDKKKRHPFRINHYRYFSVFQEGLAVVKSKIKGKYLYGYMNQKGKMVIPQKFEGASLFAQGLAPVAKIIGKRKLVGFINQKGKIVIPYRFERVEGFKEGRALVFKGRHGRGKTGFINKKGKLIIPFVYDFFLYARYRFKNGLAAVRKKKKWGYINKKGKVAIPFKYQYAHNFSR